MTHYPTNSEILGLQKRIKIQLCMQKPFCYHTIWQKYGGVYFSHGILPENIE